MMKSWYIPKKCWPVNISTSVFGGFNLWCCWTFHSYLERCSSYFHDPPANSWGKRNYSVKHYFALYVVHYTSCADFTIGRAACVTKAHTYKEALWFIIFSSVIGAHNAVFYNPVTDRWLVTVYMKCIYSVVFLKLCLNRCFQAQIQTKMQT